MYKLKATFTDNTTATQTHKSERVAEQKLMQYARENGKRIRQIDNCK